MKCKRRAQVHKGFLRAFGSVTNANNATYNIAEIWRKMTGVAPAAVTTCASPAPTQVGYEGRRRQPCVRVALDAPVSI